MIEGFFWGFMAGIGFAILIDWWTRDRTLEKPGPSQREIAEEQDRIMRVATAKWKEERSPDLANAVPFREVGTPLPPLGWKNACPPGVWKAYDNEPH